LSSLARSDDSDGQVIDTTHFGVCELSQVAQVIEDHVERVVLPEQLAIDHERRNAEHALPDCPVRVHGWRTQIRPGMALLDEIGELLRVAHEEHRRIVADQIPVAFLGVELDGEAAHVAFGIGCAEIRVPCAPQPLACTERSGMRSRTSERARGVGVPDVSERIT
jgi:hypothetical protein